MDRMTILIITAMFFRSMNSVKNIKPASDLGLQLTIILVID